MNRISKELLKIAREITALDEEGDGSSFQILHDQDNFEQNQLDMAEKQGKKYILHHKDGNLWRIKACKDFNDVKKGDFGGLIQSERNLSHEGNCWVYDSAQVYDYAQVYDNAKVYERALVCYNAQVYDNAQIFGRACIFENAQVYGNAKVYLNAQVYGQAKVYDSAQVYDYAWVSGDASVCGNAKIHGEANVDYDVKDQEITE